MRGSLAPGLGGGGPSGDLGASAAGLLGGGGLGGASFGASGAGPLDGGGTGLVGGSPGGAWISDIVTTLLGPLELTTLILLIAPSGVVRVDSFELKVSALFSFTIVTEFLGLIVGKS